jgi:hypothetical protein
MLGTFLGAQCPQHFGNGVLAPFLKIVKKAIYYFLFDHATQKSILISVKPLCTKFENINNKTKSTVFKRKYTNGFKKIP